MVQLKWAEVRAHHLILINTHQRRKLPGCSWTCSELPSGAAAAWWLCCLLRATYQSMAVTELLAACYVQPAADLQPQSLSSLVNAWRLQQLQKGLKCNSSCFMLLSMTLALQGKHAANGKQTSLQTSYKQQADSFSPGKSSLLQDAVLNK